MFTTYSVICGTSGPTNDPRLNQEKTRKALWTRCLSAAAMLNLALQWKEAYKKWIDGAPLIRSILSSSSRGIQRQDKE